MGSYDSHLNYCYLHDPNWVKFLQESYQETKSKEKCDELCFETDQCSYNVWFAKDKICHIRGSDGKSWKKEQLGKWDPSPADYSSTYGDGWGIVTLSNDVDIEKKESGQITNVRSEGFWLQYTNDGGNIVKEKIPGDV